jgi:hypothetical protein
VVTGPSRFQYRGYSSLTLFLGLATFLVNELKDVDQLSLIPLESLKLLEPHLARQKQLHEAALALAFQLQESRLLFDGLASSA